MKYTDAQNVIASQIAYYDFDAAAVSSGNYTVRELLEMDLEPSGTERSRKARELLDRIDSTPSTQECGNWTLRDVCDDKITGMYGCMLDTGNGNAIIAFRGSESNSALDYMQDWGLADLGLANNDLTFQQAAAQDYVNRLYNRYGGEYNSYAMTGHSLGGNLAMHCTITAPEGMRDKIDRCVNLDGPGFSQKYLSSHANDIAEMGDRVTHYQWSFFGNLLNPVPGSTFMTVDADTPDKGGLLNSTAWRHETVNPNYDGNGNFIEGKKDFLAEMVGPTTKILDLSLYALFGFPGISVVFDTVEKIKNGFVSLWENWQKARADSRKTRFEISEGRLRNGIDTISGTVLEIQSIANEVERIQKELAFRSTSAGIMKIKLWNVANSIESVDNKLHDYCDKGITCLEMYLNTEQKIVNHG